MTFKGKRMSATRHRLQRNALSAALVSALLLTASAAFAQDATSTDNKPSTEKKTEELDKIVVTGSRIKRDEFNSVSPVQVITREETTMAEVAID